MDWNELLADLESRFDADRRADIAAQSADLAEAERGQVVLVDRLRGAVGRTVRIGTRGGRTLAGRLLRVSEDVLLLEEGDGLQALVPLGAVAAAGPLPGPAPVGRTRRRAGLADALRGLARSGARVRVLLVGSELTGRIVRVGRDHVDVVVDGAPEGVRSAAGAVQGAVSVALGVVEAVRSR
ncbi:Fis family transcriptional regulator [Actinomyces radicidentis]|uniref:Fis family transcriptional regulator n=1 Tax=Actinomyces radicidentis TaxID=111015 RepID=UPI0026DEF93C|nr:Fis family transcriptional regulator [Actinomyces radicidentis]